jgi:hypothetical protein
MRRCKKVSTRKVKRVFHYSPFGLTQACAGHGGSPWPAQITELKFYLGTSEEMRKEELKWRERKREMSGLIVIMCD